MTILRRLIRYSEKVYGLKQMMESLRDGRVSPQIKTPTVFGTVMVMLWARMGSLNALEQTRQMRFWKWLEKKVASADTIGRVYTTMDVGLLRKALHGQYSKLKRNKAIKALEGLMVAVLDGHETTASYARHCSGCLSRQIEVAGKERTQYYHRNVTLMLTSKEMEILLDEEEQRPGEGEVTAALRLMQRALKKFPRAFEVVLADALYAGAPFINYLWGRRKYCLIVLKQENREIYQDAMGLMQGQAPQKGEYRKRQCLWWDIEGFRSWDGLDCAMRVVRSVENWQVKRQLDGQLEECHSEWVWVTNLPSCLAPTQRVVRLGHARWDIENPGFNELVNAWHGDHVYKHDPNAIEAFWLTLLLAYNLFHSFMHLNLKPQMRKGYSVKHWVARMTADFYAGPWAVELGP